MVMNFIFFSSTLIIKGSPERVGIQGQRVGNIGKERKTHQVSGILNSSPLVRDIGATCATMVAG